jgi:hypothetical protein
MISGGTFKNIFFCVLTNIHSRLSEYIQHAVYLFYLTFCAIYLVLQYVVYKQKNSRVGKLSYC